MSDHAFDELIAAWLDGRLDAQGSQALQQELKRSASARSKFRRFTQLDVALHEYADTSGMLGPAQLIADSVKKMPVDAQEHSSADFAGANPEQSRVTLPPRQYDGQSRTAFWRLAPWYATISVATLLAVSLFSIFSGGEQQATQVTQLEPVGNSLVAEEVREVSLRKPPAPVATLASAEQALWEKLQLQVGQPLFEGDSIRLQAGEARISVGFGAELVANAPCSLTFLASDRIELHEGNIAIDVAPWAKGFTVVTEEMDIVDLGTTFTVSATPGEQSETTVLKGVVRVHPSKMQNNKKRGVLVTEGRQVLVDGNGLLKNVEQQETLSLLNNLDFGNTGPYRPVEMTNTGLGLNVGDEDQHWRVVDGPETGFTGPQFASVCFPHQAYLPNDPQKSQWISITNWETAAPNATYTFQAEFNLEGYDLATMQLFGRFLADNGIESVRVNGKSVHVQSWVDNTKYQPFRDQQFRFVNVTDGLVEGRNVIEVDVRNGMQRKWDDEAKAPKLSAIPNPMALRVEWYAFGRQYRLAKTDENAKLYRQFREDNFPVTMLSNGQQGIVSIAPRLEFAN